MSGIARDRQSSLKFKRIRRRPGNINLSLNVQQPVVPSPGADIESSLMVWLNQNVEPRAPFTPDTSMTMSDFTFFNQNNPASGCFGTVLECKHKDHPSLRLAMKLIKLKPRDDTEMIHLNRELNILRKSDHENIVRWYGSTINSSTKDAVILMEYMDAGTLEVAILRGGRFPIKVLEAVIKSTITGLHYLKSAIQTAHRDIKPSNILVSQDGRITLCDFGMSKIVNSSNPTYSKFVGCRIYMSPEMLDDDSDAMDYWKSDTYSFGVTVIECAYGFYPIPMVDEIELQDHLDRWKPATARPRTNSCSDLSNLSDDEKENTYMERCIDYQPFELLCMINDKNLTIIRDEAYFPLAFSDFVNQMTLKDADERPEYEELMDTEYFKSLCKNLEAVQAWTAKIQKM